MITAVGVTQKTAPLAVRELFAFSPEAGRCLLTRLHGEALLLVTCNRTELYGTARTETLYRAMLTEVGAPEPPLFTLHGRDAVRHLLAVAAGLDSMVLGEAQILGQVRDAVALARSAGTLGPLLDRLGRQALTAGRRVRRETALGLGRPSIPQLAVRVASELVGDLRGRTLLVIGAGKVGALTAAGLRTTGAESVVVANRTLRAAQDLAREIGGRAESLEALDDLLAGADIVITCTGAPEVLLDRPRVARVLETRGGRPLAMFDIAVPRDVAPEVRDLPGVRLVDLDDLRGRASASVPSEAVGQAEAIVEQEAQAYLTWLAGREAVPTIQALQQKAEAILEAELARATNGDVQEMRRFGRRLLNKFLHHPFVRMRDRAGSHGPVYLDVARDLFALDGDDDG